METSLQSRLQLDNIQEPGWQSECLHHRPAECKQSPSGRMVSQRLNL